MTKRIITISREFGSGGRTIGRQVAEKLGVGFYDKELVKQVAVKSGLHEDYIEQNGEYASSKNWLAYAFSSMGTQGVMHGMSMDDFLWAMQRKVILELAEKEPCVIVGRCADYILKDRDDCLNVFVHASMEKRADRIVRLYGMSEKTPEKRLEDKDQKRRVYYKHYTDRVWGMAQNYHLTLDSGLIGIDRCVDMIVDLAQNT
ncbi:MAG: cytidylate kinase-like family protein [Clostridia bacterium]|nr:cytidylate kinase-like family protein [Clostridia bacterium]